MIITFGSYTIGFSLTSTVFNHDGYSSIDSFDDVVDVMDIFDAELDARCRLCGLLVDDSENMSTNSYGSIRS